MKMVDAAKQTGDGALVDNVAHRLWFSAITVWGVCVALLVAAASARSSVGSEAVEEAPLATGQVHARKWCCWVCHELLVWVLSFKSCHRARPGSVVVVPFTGYAHMECRDGSLLRGWLSMSLRSGSSGWCRTLVRRCEVMISLLMSRGAMLHSTGSHSVLVQRTAPEMVLIAWFS